MINCYGPFDINFQYKGKPYRTRAERMHISYYPGVKDFYRVVGKKYNFDIYLDGDTWRLREGDYLKAGLLMTVGNAITAGEPLAEHKRISCQ